MKKVISLIAVLFGVLAITSGAFAANHYVVTSSSQIKDGAVSLFDLTPAARKALKGKPGPTGPRGRRVTLAPLARTARTASRASPARRVRRATPAPRVRRDTLASAGTRFAPGATRRTTPTRTWARATSASAAGNRHGRLLARQSRGRRRLPVHLEDESGFNPPALSDGSGVVASFPGRMNWDTNKVKPNDNSGWIVQVNDKVNARRHDALRHLRERQLDNSRKQVKGAARRPLAFRHTKEAAPEFRGRGERVRLGKGRVVRRRAQVALRDGRA